MGIVNFPSNRMHIVQVTQKDILDLGGKKGAGWVIM